MRCGEKIGYAINCLGDFFAGLSSAIDERARDGGHSRDEINRGGTGKNGDGG